MFCNLYIRPDNLVFFCILFSLLVCSIFMAVISGHYKLERSGESCQTEAKYLLTLLHILHFFNRFSSKKMLSIWKTSCLSDHPNVKVNTAHVQERWMVFTKMRGFLQMQTMTRGDAEGCRGIFSLHTPNLEPVCYCSSTKC